MEPLVLFSLSLSPVPFFKSSLAKKAPFFRTADSDDDEEEDVEKAPAAAPVKITAATAASSKSASSAAQKADDKDEMVLPVRAFFHLSFVALLQSR